MIWRVLKSKWLWIGIVVLGIVVYSAAREWSQISQWKQQAEQLQQIEKKLKAEAKAQESSYQSKLNSANDRTYQATNQLIVLQKQNADLLERVAKLLEVTRELEKKHAELEAKKIKVAVPPARVDRVNLLNELGY